MKTHSSARCRAAFTLIEVLTVVAIVAMLAALGFAGLRFAMNKSREKDTMALITDVSKTIQEYRDEMGNYPRPAMEEEETVIDGESFKIGGARMLYQVLSGDGNDAIKGGEKISTGQQGSAKDEKHPDAGKVYMNTIQAPTKQQVQDKKKVKYVETAGDTSFYVIDAWRHPLQYQVADRDKNGQITNDVTTHSDSSYELWSYGNTKKPDDSEEAQKTWITNWGMK
jgi:prepilin-type N-terminal cleavage/methylation domain-containing protein